MNILVTGVSKGVGLELLNKLLLEGHTCFGISRTKTNHLDKLLDNYPDRFYWKSYDFGDPHSVRDELFKKWITFSTPLHGLVNNAAMAYDDIITNLDEVKLEKMYRVNVFTPIALTKYFIRHSLLHKNHSSIVHISSISAHTGYKGLAMYASTKGALEAFSKNTAREWGEKGIRSNCLVAGFMDTDMSSGLSEDQKYRIYKRTSLKKPTNIQSVISTVIYLLSEKAKSITGQNIFVDSGTI
jgi:3-oxoacyl-[acyl-carrier protein] reductase